MQMTTYFSKGSLVVKLEGEVDHHSAGQVRLELDRIIGENMPKTMVLELSGICFMDSSGLGLILGRYKKLSDIGSRMIIKNPLPSVERILRMAGVDKLIKIITDNDPEEIKAV